MTTDTTEEIAVLARLAALPASVPSPIVGPPLSRSPDWPTSACRSPLIRPTSQAASSAHFATAPAPQDWGKRQQSRLAGRSSL